MRQSTQKLTGKEPETLVEDNNKVRVLHVDDSEQDHELTRYNIKRLAGDLEIDWAESGGAALDKLGSSHYSCVLSDFQMPEMNGLEFLAALRKTGIQTPFIFLTGQGNEEVAAEALRAGADDYFTKDAFFAHYERLVNSIRRLVAQRHQAEAKERAERALKESQRMLSTLMSNLPGMAYRCDNTPEWTMRFISEGCYDLTGYRRQELMDDQKVSFSDLIHPDDRDMVWQEVQAAINEDRPFTLRYRIITAGGEEKWVWERGRLVHSNDGGTGSLEGFISDVSDQMALQLNVERLRFAFQVIPDAISISRASDGLWVDINEVFEKLTGYLRDDVIGRTAQETNIWANSEDRERFVEILQTNGEVRNYSAQFRMKDGSVRKGLMTSRRFLFEGEEHLLTIVREVEPRG